MVTHRRPVPSAHRLLVTELQGTADRLGGWHPPTGQARQVAVADLQEIGGNNQDAYAEAAGIMLGCHPEGDVSHDRYRVAAELILEAAGLTRDDEQVRHWITVGEERRTRTRRAFRTGDTFGRSFEG